MLAAFFSWWIARIAELPPASWRRFGVGVADGIVVEFGPDQILGILVRRKGRRQPITLGAAARLASRLPVIICPPPDAVLEKHHTVPTAPRRELSQMLRYELDRITPFSANDLLWAWDGRAKPGDRTRTDVILTLVPKVAIFPILDALQTAGIQPRWVEVGPLERPRRVPIEDDGVRATERRLIRGLTWTCAGLAVVAVVLPALLQEAALHATNAAIDELQPAISQIEVLRRGLSANGAGRDLLARESEQIGDLLKILATVTRILPDDTYLTDFSLRDRRMALGGRSAAAARLITALSADPTVRNAAFAAPVTRVEGATAEVFSIRADVGP